MTEREKAIKDFVQAVLADRKPKPVAAILPNGALASNVYQAYDIGFKAGQDDMLIACKRLTNSEVNRA